jgi:protein-disulfide isomerase
MRRSIQLTALPLLLGLLAVLTIFPCTAFAQPDDLRALSKEIEALREDQRALRQELQEIKTLLRQQSTPSARDTLPVLIEVGGRPFKGDSRAKVTLIEFSDYQCPFCGRHARETMPQIEREYISTGKVKYVLRDFPLVPVHKQALKAAEAVHCASEHGKYWEMHDSLFANQQALSPEGLVLHAKAAGLDPEQFRRCLESGKYAPEIRQELADGLKSGVRATPTFFLGLTDMNDSRIRAVRIIRGAQSYAAFKEAIEALLASQD